VLTLDIDIEPVVQHYLLYKTITILKISQSNGFVLLYFELANLCLYWSTRCTICFHQQ